MAKIPGGYFLKARCVQQSDIAKAPPHVREIWDWFLMNANHTPHKHLKRGQLLCTYNDIREGLSWYIGYRKCQYTKAQCETAMKWLKKTTMVTAMKTTRGMIITVLNYDKYQNARNYENHNENYTGTTTEPQWHDTTNKNEKNDKNGKENTGGFSSSRCPHQKIIEEYHTILPELNTVDTKLWGDSQRSSWLQARWREDTERQNIDWWVSFFETVKKSDFLTGKAKNWKADLGWLVKKENFIKVLEGNYANRSSNNPTYTPKNQREAHNQMTAGFAERLLKKRQEAAKNEQKQIDEGTS